MVPGFQELKWYHWCLLLTSSADDYIKRDGVTRCPEPTTNDIVRISMKEREDDNSEREKRLWLSSSTEDCVMQPKKVLLSTETIKKYLSQQNNVLETFYTILNNTEDFCFEKYIVNFSEGKKKWFFSKEIKLIYNKL